jgi:hypothetical protein
MLRTLNPPGAPSTSPSFLHHVPPVYWFFLLLVIAFEACQIKGRHCESLKSDRNTALFNRFASLPTQTRNNTNITTGLHFLRLFPNPLGRSPTQVGKLPVMSSRANQFVVSNSFFLHAFSVADL